VTKGLARTNTPADEQKSANTNTPADVIGISLLLPCSYERNRKVQDSVPCRPDLIPWYVLVHQSESKDLRRSATLKRDWILLTFSLPPDRSDGASGKMSASGAGGIEFKSPTRCNLDKWALAQNYGDGHCLLVTPERV